jgi:hypothetical protein
MTEPVRLVKYEPWHLEKLELQASQETEKAPVIHGDAVTFLMGETVLAIFGGFPFGAGILQGWSLLSKHICPNKIRFHKQAKIFVPYVMEKLAVRRLQVSVRTDNDRAFRWAKSLGFQCEGVMRSYGPNGEAYWLFARCA